MEKQKPSKQHGYFPYVLIASALYFAISLTWLLAKDIALLSAAMMSLVVFALMTGAIFFLYPRLRKFEDKTPKENKSDQTNYRRDMWIEGLKREAAKKHDTVFQTGAVISVALVVFALIMKAIFGLSPAETYLVSWPLVLLIWFLQIALFSRSVNHTSFIVFAILRVSIQIFGFQILAMLPQFAMLPVFYLLMMFFMYGSIMLPNLAQQKYFKPGQGNWEVELGSTRGQREARAIIDTQIKRFKDYAAGKTKIKPTRGMVFEGPPGLGKTLYAMEIASDLRLPCVISDASAFNAPFAGFGQLIPLIVRAKTESMAKEYGGAVVFIDEGEILFSARAGMQPSQQARDFDIFDVLPRSGSIQLTAPGLTERRWNEQQMATSPAPTVEGILRVFMMPGGGGQNAGIFPMLTWMSGTNSAPLIKRMKVSLLNTLLDSLFIPVVIFGKVLRLPAAKAEQQNIMFITATNRYKMFDPAMLRPGRFGVTAHFKNPDEEERYDTAKYYLGKLHKLGLVQEDLMSEVRLREFAKAVEEGTSYAKIEQIINESVDKRAQHVDFLKRIKDIVDKGQFATLLDHEKKFWKRFKVDVYDANDREIPGWDTEKVNWHALMETKNAIRYGAGSPQDTNGNQSIGTGIHEVGHLLGLKAFNGDRMKPTLLTVMPRSDSLGMVAYIPFDTREQHPQEFYEGMVRTSVASWVTERFFKGQNLPGVSADLRSATNVAALMIARFGMSNFQCPEKNLDYFARIGEDLISEPDDNIFNPEAAPYIKSVLANPVNRRKISIILGMATVDAYALIRKNKELYFEIVPELVAIDEFTGTMLTDLWNSLDSKLVKIIDMPKKDRNARPKDAFAVVNSFRQLVHPEGAEVLSRIKEKITGGVS